MAIYPKPDHALYYVMTGKIKSLFIPFAFTPFSLYSFPSENLLELD